MNIRSINYYDPNWFRSDMTLVNCDAGFPIHIMAVDLSSREAILKSADDYLEIMSNGSRLTDMSFCIFNQTSFVDSSSADWIFRKISDTITDYINTEDKPGEYFTYEKRKHFQIYPLIYEAFQKFEIDWPQIATECCLKRNIRPWIAIRMNDLHGVDQDDCPYHDSFFFKAKANGWLIGNPAYGRPIGTSGHVENLYNFAHPEVREWYLTYIEEMMLRYNVFGFEIDFMRNIYCFDYLQEAPGYQEYMNDFIRKVHALRKKAEEKHGHPIKLSVRLGHTVEHNYIYGFDVKTWVKEGLVDVLVACCEEVINSGVDIADWRKAIGNDISLLIGYDDHITRWADAGAEYIYQATPAHIKGISAGYFNQGVNGLYLHNFYAPSQVKFGKDMDRESCEQGLRTFVMTHEDIYPIGSVGYKPLPMVLSDKGASGTDIAINMGLIRPEEYVYVVAGFDKRDGNILVTLNGMIPVEVKEVPVIFDKVAGHYYDDDRNLLKSAQLMRYAFRQVDLSGAFTLHFTDSTVKDLNMVYLEVSATPDAIQ